MIFGFLRFSVANIPHDKTQKAFCFVKNQKPKQFLCFKTRNNKVKREPCCQTRVSPKKLLSAKKHFGHGNRKNNRRLLWEIEFLQQKSHSSAKENSYSYLLRKHKSIFVSLDPVNQFENLVEI